MEKAARFQVWCFFQKPAGSGLLLLPISTLLAPSDRIRSDPERKHHLPVHSPKPSILHYNWNWNGGKALSLWAGELETRENRRKVRRNEQCVGNFEKVKSSFLAEKKTFYILVLNWVGDQSSFVTTWTKVVKVKVNWSHRQQDTTKTIFVSTTFLHRHWEEEVFAKPTW